MRKRTRSGDDTRMLAAFSQLGARRFTYAAQENPQVDAEIAEKRCCWTGTV